MTTLDLCLILVATSPAFAPAPAPLQTMPERAAPTPMQTAPIKPPLVRPIKAPPRPR
jgi:hypothetical protein